MKTRAEYAGRSITCRACQATTTVPGATITRKPPAASPARSTVPPSRPRRAEPDDGAADDEPEAPRKRRRKARQQRPVWPWVAAAAGVLVLVGVGLTIWLVVRRDSPVASNTPSDKEKEVPKEGGDGKGKDAKDDLALVPADAPAFAALRVADVWKSDDVKVMLDTLRQQAQMDVRPMIATQEAEFGVSLRDLERVTGVVGDASDITAVWAVFCTSRPYNEKQLRRKIIPDGVEMSSGKRKYYASPQQGAEGALYCHSDRIFVVGTKKGVLACLQQIENPRTAGALKDALRAADDKRHLVIGLSPPADMIAEMRQKIPNEAKQFDALLDAKTAVLATDLVGATIRTELTLTYPDGGKAAKAKGAADALKSLAVAQLAQLKEELKRPGVPPEARLAFEKLETILKGTKVELKNDTVLVSLTIEGASGSAVPFMVGMVLPAVQKVREATTRAQSSNNLKQLAVAFHNYHSVNNAFPPAASYGPQGQPLLSWRVHLLPYIEEEQLYKEFHLNEPWNSPHNIKLLDRMPRSYHIPNQPSNANQTHFQVFVGGNQAPFLRGFARGAGPHNARSRRLTDITDGAGNTIAIAEAARAVEWTRPDDIAFNPGPGGFPPGQLGLPGATVVNVALFDGTVLPLPKTIDPKKLQALITPNGGERVNPLTP